MNVFGGVHTDTHKPEVASALEGSRAPQLISQCDERHTGALRLTVFLVKKHLHGRAPLALYHRHRGGGGGGGGRAVLSWQ